MRPVRPTVLRQYFIMPNQGLQDSSAPLSQEEGERNGSAFSEKTCQGRNFKEAPLKPQAAADFPQKLFPKNDAISKKVCYTYFICGFCRDCCPIRISNRTISFYLKRKRRMRLIRIQRIFAVIWDSPWRICPLRLSDLPRGKNLFMLFHGF